MSTAQISTSVTIINSLLGFQAISFTNMGTSAVTAITAGSKVEIGSAFFNFPADETPQASTWTAIATGGTAYITLLPVGAAGSQTLTVRYTDDGPTWSDSKQGWYDATTSSIIRYIGSVYKDGTSSYEQKHLLEPFERLSRGVVLVATGLTAITQGQIIERVLSIGDWNMQSTTAVNILHGIGDRWKDIRDVGVMVRNDADTELYVLDEPALTLGSPGAAGGVARIAVADVRLNRDTGGVFDSVNFNSTSYNRGWITLRYVF